MLPLWLSSRDNVAFSLALKIVRRDRFVCRQDTRRSSEQEFALFEEEHFRSQESANFLCKSVHQGDGMVFRGTAVGSEQSNFSTNSPSSFVLRLRNKGG